MEAVDTLISARWVIPIEPSARVLERHAVAVSQGRIVAVMPADEAFRKFRAREVVERPTHALLPGFVNAQADLALLLPPGALRDAWRVAGPPSPPAAADPELLADIAALAMLRMTCAGTTCAGGPTLFGDIVAKTAAELAMRTCIGLPILAGPSAWAASTDECFDKAGQSHDEYREHPLVSTAYALADPGTLTDTTLARLRRDADEIERPVLMPLDRPASVHRLERIGLLSPLLAGSAADALTDAEVSRLREAGASVIVTPRATLAACFRAPHCRTPGDWLAAGLNVAIGTGAQPAFDMRGDLQVALLLGARTGAPAADPALALLRMATLGGAQALGIAEITGSLATGKWADLACHDLADPRSLSFEALAARVAGLADAPAISDVWIAGRTVVADGRPVRADAASRMARLAHRLS